MTLKDVMMFIFSFIIGYMALHVPFMFIVWALYWPGELMFMRLWALIVFLGLVLHVAHENETT